MKTKEYLIYGILVILILISLLGIVYLPHILNNEEKVCSYEYERVCYKIECSNYNCGQFKINCNSNDVDIITKQLSRLNCQWERK